MHPFWVYKLLNFESIWYTDVHTHLYMHNHPCSQGLGHLHHPQSPLVPFCSQLPSPAARAEYDFSHHHYSFTCSAHDVNGIDSVHPSCTQHGVREARPCYRSAAAVLLLPSRVSSCERTTVCMYVRLPMRLCALPSFTLLWMRLLLIFILKIFW